MLVYFTLIMLGVLPNQAQFTNDKASVVVNVSSNIYTYTVSNNTTDPVVGFEIAEHACYNFKTPERWESDTSGGTFKCWTEDSFFAITPNKAGKFSLRVSSNGAVLGTATVRLKFQSGAAASIPGVWAPVREPETSAIFVAAAMLVIIAAHILILTLRDRRNRKC
ncbi:MAG: hypothetical protein J7M40_04105 [Planctomycetes bacterium]|nr:hypothetical protein [Planctomycetota bacterium]